VFCAVQNGRDALDIQSVLVKHATHPLARHLGAATLAAAQSALPVVAGLHWTHWPLLHDGVDGVPLQSALVAHAKHAPLELHIGVGRGGVRKYWSSKVELWRKT
jgi:hypothetical protein